MATSLRASTCNYYIVNNAAGEVHLTGGGIRQYRIKVVGGDVYLLEGAATIVGADVVLPVASGDPCGPVVLNGEVDRIITSGAAIAMRCRPGVTATVHLTYEA